MNRLFRLTMFLIYAGYVCRGHAFAEYSIPGYTAVRTTLVGSVIVAAVISLILAGYAMRNSYIKRRIDEIKNADERSVMPIILQEVERLGGAFHKKEETAVRLFNVVQTSVNFAKNEVSEKYGKILKEKEEKEVLLQRKYDNTLVEKKQTETIVRSIAEGLVVVDDKGKVLLMNPAAERLLGASKENKIGKSLMENIKDEQLFTLAKNVAGRNEKEIEFSSSQDATKKTLRASSAVIEDEEGKTVGMVSVLSDVTKLRELEQMKSDFVNKVTHELRTPIETLKNSIYLMMNGDTGPLTEDQKKFLSISERNVKRLSMLIDSLLDSAKLQEKKMELSLETYSAGRIITEACESLSAWAINKSIKLITDVQEGIPEIKVDREKITQVLNNLVGNAIKFTPRGGSINLSVKLTENRDGVEIGVVDSGPGIPKEDLDRIFDKFYQGKGERAVADISGTGLGLYITKEIVVLHGGKIRAESEKGEGARFTFILPIKSS